MRTAWLLSVCVLGLLTYEGRAAAQTAVEYGAGAGASAGAAAGAKGLGKSIGAAFDSVGKALKQAQDPSSKVEPASSAAPPVKLKTAAAKAAAGPAAAPVALRPSYEDAMGIQKSMSCEEVVRRFGPPAMEFATEDDAKTMSYSSKAGGVQVECQGGKVASVEKPQ